MSTTVSFPGLGISLEVNNVAFTIGGIEVYWYGIFLAICLLVGFAFALKNCKRFGVDSDRMMDVILVGAICAIIGGRLYYVLFSGQSYETFFEMIDLRSGGIAFYGVFIGGTLGALIMCRLRKVKFLPMMDMTATAFMMVQWIGRLGNFTNQEAFGCNTTLPWGMTSSKVVSYLTAHATELAAHGVTVDPSMPVHPYFIYEGLWTLCGAIFLLCYIKRRHFDGELLLMYLMWYGTGRAVLEGFRTDSLYIGTLRVSQLISAVVAVAAVAAIIAIRLKQKKTPDWKPPYASTEQCRLDAEALAAERAEKAAKKSAKKPVDAAQDEQAEQSGDETADAAEPQPEAANQADACDEEAPEKTEEKE